MSGWSGSPWCGKMVLRDNQLPTEGLPHAAPYHRTGRPVLGSLEEGRRCAVRPEAQQLRRRGDPAQGVRREAGAERAAGGVPVGRPAAVEGVAFAGGAVPAAHVRDCLRLRRLQRRGAAGGRSGDEAAGGVGIRRRAPRWRRSRRCRGSRTRRGGASCCGCRRRWRSR